MVTYIKKHYHWIIAVIVFLEMIVFGGLINSASIFIQPISKSLGVPTTSYSVAMIPYTLACFTGTCFSGYLFGRFGYKKVAVLSLILISGSLVLTSVAQDLVVFCISKIMFGMGYAACLTAGAVYIIKLWFWKHQGLVLGAVNMATGLGGSLMTIILNASIEAVDWRFANLVAAAAIAVIAVLYLFLKDRPEQMKLRPYGMGSSLQSAKKVRVRDHDYPGYPFSEQLKRPLFYLMCFAVLVSCVCLYTLSSFVIPHFRSIGFTSDMAATYQSVYMLTLAAAKLLVGYLYDRIGAKPVTVICMLFAVAGQGMLGLFTDPTLSMVGILLFSVGLCMSSMMVPLIAAPLFGYRACLSVNGIFLGISSLASIFASPISSMSYDSCGLYTPVYKVAAVVNIGVLVLYMAMFSMAKKEKKRFYQIHPDEH